MVEDARQGVRASGMAMKRSIGKFFRDARGATAIEYGLIAALIVIALMAGLVALGESTAGLWGDISDKVAKAS